MIAVVVSLVVVASDWPLGSDFWFDHPLVAAFVGGLLLLLIAGAVVDRWLRLREARRWVDIGRGAAHAMDAIFWQSSIAMMHLIGVGGASRLGGELEPSIGPARARAHALLPVSNPADDAWVHGEYDETRAIALERERLPILLVDVQWRTHTLMAIFAISETHKKTLPVWISAFGALDDRDGFARTARTIELLDYSEALIQELVELSATDPAPPDAARATRITSHWRELVHRYYHEQEYWEARHVLDSPLGPSAYPMTTRTLRDRAMQ